MRLPKNFTKYATASSLEDISKSIAKFYGGETKELRPYGNDEFSIHSLKDGRKLITIVLVISGRFYFGALDAT